MNSAIERLLTLRVEDVMTRQVFSVSRHDSMASAARSLLEHSVSGAPVVDERQACVGVLSAIDFVKQHGCTCHEADDTKHTLDRDDVESSWQIDRCRNDLVCHHMSSGVQSIAADKPLLAAARVMCAEHIHRMPVLDDRGRPVGMITALDVVAALTNVVEE